MSESKTLFVVLAKNNPIQQTVIGVFSEHAKAAAFIGKWPPHAKFTVSEIELDVESVSLVSFVAPAPEPEAPPAA